MTTQTPYQWLQDLDRRAKQKSKGLPRAETIQQIWRGIAYRIGETRLVTTIHDIREILHYPRPIAKVPGAKPWVKGLANVRGLLLPVMDLQACIEGTPITLAKPTRVIIINQDGMTAGLVVDEVLGLKHFPEPNRDLETPCKQPWLTPFARGRFNYEEASWTVFDMHALVKSDEFLKAAL